MLEARPQGCCSAVYALYEGETQVAEFRHGWWREAAELVVGDQLFHIDREKWNGPFRLLAGDEVVLEAARPSKWKPRMIINVGDEVMDLRPQGYTAKTWLITNQDGTILGKIGRYSWWSRKSYVELPEGTPISAQAFILCLAVFIWNRQAAVGAAS